jgi:hypothetical protein
VFGSLIPPLYRWLAVALAVVLGALALAAWDASRLKKAEKRGADAVRAEYTAAALREAQVNAAETARRLKAQQENQRVQDAALARARADAARAAADADRVRAQATEAAREWGARLGDSPSAGDSQAAGAAIGVCADVLGRAVAHARILAGAADAARAAGLKCEADYDALTPK